MFTLRVAPSQLIDRLNAESNSPEFVVNASVLSSCKLNLVTLKETVTGPINNSIRNITSELNAEGATIPMFRPADIDGWWLNVDTAPKLTKEFEEQHRKARVKPGDIVLSIAGTIGTAARVPSSIKYGNINGSSARIPTKESIASYLLAYLNSNIGNRALLRLAVGSVQKHLNLEDLPNVPVALPNHYVQMYIGNKVLQAERLREWAFNLQELFKDSIVSTYPDAFGDIKFKSKHSRATAENINSTLNPGAYNAERLRVRSYMVAKGAVKLSTVASVSTPVTDIYKPEQAYIGLDSISSDRVMLSPSTVEAERISGSCRKLMEGPVISKLRPYLNKVAYIPKELNGAVGSTELLCIIPNNHISGWYIYGVLKLTPTLRQLNPVATGATHPRISKEDVLDLYIPYKKELISLGNLLRQSYYASEFSRRLTIAAKLLVEALIEGHLTESELEAAQQALENGDNSFDKAILARLTVKGIDIEGEPPLFPDLDALHQLLAEAEAATDKNTVAENTDEQAYAAS